MLNLANKKDKKGRVLKEGEDQLNDGRYRYRYTDANGKRHAVYSWKLTTTDRLPVGKRQCKSLREKEFDIQKDLVDGIDTYGAQITVNELIERYLATKVGIVLSTKNYYLRMWRSHIKESSLGKKPISKVKNSDITMFYAHLSKVDNLANATISTMHGFINPAFKMAVKDNLIRANPCSGCLHDYKIEETTRTSLTKQEQKAILNFLQNGESVYSFYYPLIYFLSETGLRISEAFGLTWENIDFDKKIIHVNHQLIYEKVDGSYQYYITLPKNKKTRDVPFSDDLAKVLNQYWEDTKSLRAITSHNVDGFTNFIFYTRFGKLFNLSVSTRLFRQIKNAYNSEEELKVKVENRRSIILKDFTAHILRHTFCTRMAELGMDIKVLQTIMGHSDIKITMQVYNHVNETRLLNEFSRIKNS